MLGIPASTLRYYDSEGLLPELERDSAGRRRFSDRDVEACRMIECLKESRLSVDNIREFMTMAAKGDDTLAQRLEFFEEGRESVQREIEQLERALAVIDYKRWYYQQALAAGTEDAVRNLPDTRIPACHKKAKALLGGSESS